MIPLIPVHGVEFRHRDAELVFFYDGIHNIK
jgi:hypothetical protein